MRPARTGPLLRRPLSARLATLGAVTAALVTLVGQPAVAAPRNPSDAELAAAQSAQEATAAEVGRIAGLVAAAQADLERVALEARAAADAELVAEAELERAQAVAASAAAELEAARVAVGQARSDVATLGRESYMRGSTLTAVAAMVSAEGPAQMLQQAATLELLGDQRTETLQGLEVAQVRQANADSAARESVTARDHAEQAASEARATAERRMASSQSAFDAAAAQKTTYDQQLQQAQVTLLGLQGARDAYEAWRQEQAARAAAEAAGAEAAARAAADAAARARAEQDTGNPTPRPNTGTGTAVAPTSGRFTTCYEMRWGTMHYGVDIAAPIGTPIYSPLAGRVLRAGPATGFGLAVYVQHDDGSVTVYGHINDYFVRAGQRVSAGEVIAEVGNTGQSTGPHLHFEVHTDGMYQGRTNPIPWLAARGVDMGGRCR
ncbi:M23 family peptidase [Blastococcus sp. TF02-8]|nr:M23 family peptidase [Blastococcus sp. TF02-8]